MPETGAADQVQPGGRISAGSLALDPFLSGVLWSGDERGGLHLSPDCGKTWIRTNEDDTFELNPIGKSANWSIAVDHVQQGVIFLSAGYGADVIFRSRDWGQTWVDTMDVPAGSPPPEFRFTNNVTMDPEDHLHLITTPHSGCQSGGNCVLETWDGGDTWKRKDALFGWIEGGGARILNKDTWIYTSRDHMSINDVDTRSGGGNDQFSNELFVPGPDGAYYLAGTDGVFRSTDCGVTWKVIFGGNSSGFTPRAMSAKKLFVGVQWKAFGAGIKWAAFNADGSAPMTFLDLPEIPGLKEVGGVFFLTYDRTYDLLFASTEAGVFRMKISE